MLLADEINRTPPKTQSALLEGMAEQQVSVGGTRHALPNPFFVLATQNPIEQEGTYPLPEAQLDRFLMKVLVRYPSEIEERSDLPAHFDRHSVTPQPVLERRGDARLAGDCPQSAGERLLRELRRHAGPLHSRRRSQGPAVHQGLGAVGRRAARRAIADRRGPGPRGARRPAGGRSRDIQAMVAAVLRHRIVLNYNAEAQGQTAETVIQKLVDAIPLDRAAERNP